MDSFHIRSKQIPCTKYGSTGTNCMYGVTSSYLCLANSMLLRDKWQVQIAVSFAIYVSSSEKDWLLYIVHEYFMKYWWKLYLKSRYSSEEGKVETIVIWKLRKTNFLKHNLYWNKMLKNFFSTDICASTLSNNWKVTLQEYIQWAQIQFSCYDSPLNFHVKEEKKILSF